ncbi:MAG: Mor transcription activator family protein [Odoribacter splanchnicus]
MSVMLTRDMQLVAEVIGEDAALKLMCRLGGVSIYIPRPGPADILAKLRSNAMDVKVTAAQLGVSERKVYRVLKEFRDSREDRRQMTIFDSPDYRANNEDYD